MSTRDQRRWQRALAGGGLCLITAAGGGGCGKTEPARGGLVLVVSSDGPLPLDRLDIDVSNNGTGKKLLSNTYRVPQEASLPTTVAIVSNGDATAQVKISVTGWEGAVPLDRRDAIVTQVPTDHVVILTLALSARCSSKLTVGADGSAQSSCGEGKTCDDQGACVSAAVAASALPVYHAGDENNVSVPKASSNDGSGGEAGVGATMTAGDAGMGAAMTASDAGMGAVMAGSDGGMGAVTTGGASETGGAAPVDSCANLACNAPPSAACKTAALATTYASTGTCSAGKCSYAPTDKRCDSNTVCSGAGVCSPCKADSSCGASCTACGAATPKCKDLGTTSHCVACLSDGDCASTAPFCDATSNTCVAARSCIGLAATCGPSGNASCCASGVVTGGTFNRGNDASYPATVSDFRLDTYEVSVGRFKKFLAAYAQPTAGSGKNPNNPSDPGWDAAWNMASLAASASLLTAAVKCNATYQTFTVGDDALPMNCLDWYEAQAFCIWDGGRLPTEAEWNYAAAGGAAQRAYPWGSTAADCTYANFKGAAAGSDYCVAPGTGGASRVGSESPKGDGFYGQADLAGNVWEWVQDWYVTPYTNPCTNCASTATSTSLRVLRGGGSFNGTASLLSAYRYSNAPGSHYNDFGARCARAR